MGTTRNPPSPSSSTSSSPSSSSSSLETIKTSRPSTASSSTPTLTNNTTTSSSTSRSQSIPKSPSKSKSISKSKSTPSLARPPLPTLPSTLPTPSLDHHRRQQANNPHFPYSKVEVQVEVTRVPMNPESAEEPWSLAQVASILPYLGLGEYLPDSLAGTGVVSSSREVSRSRSRPRGRSLERGEKGDGEEGRKRKRSLGEMLGFREEVEEDVNREAKEKEKEKENMKAEDVADNRNDGMLFNPLLPTATTSFDFGIGNVENLGVFDSSSINQSADIGARCEQQLDQRPGHPRTKRLDGGEQERVVNGVSAAQEDHCTGSGSSPDTGFVIERGIEVAEGTSIDNILRDHDGLIFGNPPLPASSLHTPTSDPLAPASANLSSTSSSSLPRPPSYPHDHTLCFPACGHIVSKHIFVRHPTLKMCICPNIPDIVYVLDAAGRMSRAALKMEIETGGEMCPDCAVRRRGGGRV